MSKLSLAGEWKLRGEFMDVTADRCAEVLVHLNAMPPKPTIPGYLTEENMTCLLYTSPSPRDGLLSRMPSSA